MIDLKWRLVPLVALGFGLVSTAASAAPSGHRAAAPHAPAHTGHAANTSNGAGQAPTARAQHKEPAAATTAGTGSATAGGQATGTHNATGTTNAGTPTTKTPAGAANETTSVRPTTWSANTGTSTSAKHTPSATSTASTTGTTSAGTSTTSGTTTAGQSTSNKHHTSNNSTNATANPHALTVLHQAHKLLAQADHDYKGHRAKAEAQISHAIRELSGTHNGAHHIATGAVAGNAANKAGGANAGIKVANNAQAGAQGNQGQAGNGMRMPQAQSDAHLQQALGLLNGLNGHIPNGHNAAAHVHLAITELHDALKVR